MKTFVCLFIAVLFHGKIRVQGVDEFGPDDARAVFEFGAARSSEVQNATIGKHLRLEDIVIIARTQANSYHIKKAKIFEQHLVEQIQAQDKLVLRTLHGKWAPFGAWTIFPILQSLSKSYGKDKAWIVFCEEDSIIDLQGLVSVLGRFDANKTVVFLPRRGKLMTKEYFLGHAIQDHQPAIIHHFAFAEDPSVFSFPDFAAGWAISTPLLNRLSTRLDSEPLKSDFTIDIQHEVAIYVRDEGRGVLLTDVPEFCSSKPGDEKNCVTSFNHTQLDCGEVPKDDIFFAVKTTKKFHDTRVPVVKRTLGKHAKHLVYFSETEDPAIPTENIGVPNTEMGHCAKLKAIIDRSAHDRRFADKPWVVIMDDDTIMSVPRMQRLLACYDPKEPILLGERYGFGVAAGFGYEYVTGGGGMVLSRGGVDALLKSDCSCWQADSPDDMWLGNCFRSLNIPITHSPAFHQARHVEYVPSLLAHQTAVSFHKHYEIDPMAVYNEYLS